MDDKIDIVSLLDEYLVQSCTLYVKPRGLKLLSFP